MPGGGQEESQCDKQPSEKCEKEKVKPQSNQLRGPGKGGKTSKIRAPDRKTSAMTQAAGTWNESGYKQGNKASDITSASRSQGPTPETGRAVEDRKKIVPHPAVRKHEGGNTKRWREAPAMQQKKKKFPICLRSGKGGGGGGCDRSKNDIQNGEKSLIHSAAGPEQGTIGSHTTRGKKNRSATHAVEEPIFERVAKVACPKGKNPWTQQACTA